MLTTQCNFSVTHDGHRHEVIYYLHTGMTHIFINNKNVCTVKFVCEDRKAAELIVNLFTTDLKTIKP